jgi:hypothetical protein
MSDTMTPNDQTLSPKDTDRLEKEYDRHIHFYEFYLEYGLKAVAVYYAVVGGILSINGKMDSAVLRVLLFLSIVMSAALGSTFLWGAWKWGAMVKHINMLAVELKIPKPDTDHPDTNIDLLKPPDARLLTYLLLLFGVLFIVTAGVLIRLRVKLVVNA